MRKLLLASAFALLSSTFTAAHAETDAVVDDSAADRDISITCGCAEVSNPFWGYQVVAQATNLRNGRIIWTRALSQTFLGPGNGQACMAELRRQVASNGLCQRG